LSSIPWRTKHQNPKRLIPISEDRLNANRENARHSSGTKTPEGKKIVAQNATAHGLTGKFRILKTKLQSEYGQLSPV